MKAISLLNIVPIAVGLGACTNVGAPREPRPASESLAADPPAFATIRSLSWAGSGCPAGTVAGNLAPDLTAFTLLFDSYVAEIGPGLPLSLSRRNCQILVDLDSPQGWSYSVFDFDYRGFANIPSGVSGILESKYFFQGQSYTARLATTLRGPRNGDYQIRDSLPLDAVVWSPCGAQRGLLINVAVRLENHSGNSNARGSITLVTPVYGLQWRRCVL